MADETVSGVLGEVRELLGTLEGKRETLVEARDQLGIQIAELEEQRDEYDKAIAEVDRVLGPMKTVPQPRNSGVKQLAEQVLRHLSGQENGWVSQAAILRAAIGIDPAMKEHSLVSSLGRLIKEEVCERRGKRGSYEYRVLTAGQSTAAASTPSTSLTAGTEPEKADADPEEVILAKLDDAGIDGCTKRDLAWAVGDGVAIDKVLDKLVLDGEVIGDGIRYVRSPRVAEPRSLFDRVDEEDVSPAAS